MKKTALSAAALMLTLATAAVSSYAAYNDVILADKPVMFLGMDTASSGSQSDLSGNANSGSYVGGTPGAAALPDGENAADFNGSSQYLTVKASPALSVPTSKALTIESWVRPDTLQFPHSEDTGYVYWLGKGNPTQGYEYANRMYSLTNSENRPNRMSDYDWNTSGGLGSGAYFQDAVTAGQWIYVVDTIDMTKGTIAIYKNGVLRETVPLSQYSVTPATTQSPFNVGTRNNNSYFEGAIGKVAVYNYILTSTQVANHYAAMTSAGSSSGGGTTATAPAITNVAAATVTQNGATVDWTTDQVSASQVEYGLTSSYGTLTPQSTTTGTSHSVALAGLTAGTVYHYAVKSYDSTTGLTGVSGDNTFTTAAGSVATAPAITAIQSSGITQNGATIAWTTDQASDSQVEYGLTTSYGTLTPQSTTAVTSHSVTLSGLTAGTLYHYSVKSLDSTTGLTGVSADNTFTTQAATAASDVISDVKAQPTSSEATFTWDTTVVSHSQVEYGPTSSYGSLSYQSVATGTSHELQLTGLKSGTTYHYRVMSLDASGSTAVSEDMTFTTSGGGRGRYGA